jgi:Zn-dependent peptidase ImmA (M78 family)
MFLENKHFYKVEIKVTELLKKYGITSPPIPIKDIVRKESVELLSYDLGENVSGILVIENGKGTIGYSPNNSRMRQRFTIAHELGHYILHRQARNEVFVDKDFIVKYRSEKKYSQAEIRQEQEANAFAAFLLMPKALLQAELARKDYQDLSETEFISAMAKVFDVSIPAMTYRLSNANLFI